MDMKQLSGLFLIILLLISCSSGDGVNNKAEYKIDPGITTEVAENTRKEDKLDIGSMEIRYYEDDSLVSETFSNEKSVPFWIMQEHSTESIQIDGVVGMFDAWGIHLELDKTKFSVAYFSGADFGIYKKQKSDTVLSPGIYLKCKHPSLTLQAYPQFEDGEEISGIIEFQTPEYWEVSNGKEKKVRIEGRAYFRAIIQ
jgi:hypothetical protein